MNLPKQIEIVEVGPRDGFQNIKTWIPTNVKLAIIDALVKSGFHRMEVTSFVHPQAIPQMADAAEVVETVQKRYGEALMAIALVPNVFGAKKAFELGVNQVTFVLSASERHNRENTRRTVAQSLDELREVCRMKGKSQVRLIIATAFACPFLGTMDPQQVAQIAEEGLAAGVDELILADTIGSANPAQVEHVLQFMQARFPGLSFGLHLHDTRGMGLANAVKALEMGITCLESAIGGLGGCPFAPGAAGNIATEDLVHMLGEMGIQTGINEAQLIQAAKRAGAKLNVELTGHMVKVNPACAG